MRIGAAIRLALFLVPAVAVSVGLGLHKAAGSAAVNGGAHAEYLQTFVWSPPRTERPVWFGGFSGIEVLDGGTEAVVINDRAHLAHIAIQRDGGEIQGIDITGHTRLRAESGRLLKDRIVDSEGLALREDGTAFISFEGKARVIEKAESEDTTRILPRPKPFRSMPVNKALEALAIDDRGWLYTLPENATDAQGNLPVWRWNGHRWHQPFALPSRGRYLPVGADFGPDGRFYLLERDFWGFGFRNRLRRWDMIDNRPANETILMETGLATHDNLEGIAIWRDGDGALRATMISDDNFLFLQRSEIVEYRLPD